MTEVQKRHNAFHQMYEDDENAVAKKPLVLPLRIVLQLIIYALLVVFAYVSYLFPPIGIPGVVILFYNKKRHYALFPLAGIIFLFVTQMLGIFMMLFTY